jgi:hypothetical protein
VTVSLRVSGGEKFAIGLGAYGGEDGLKQKAVELARDIQAKLPSACPGAPKLESQPKVTMKDVDGGYKVFVRWVARWSHDKKGPLKPRVVECMSRLVKADENIGERVKSLTAVRL